jgi:hypothetical protein
MEVRQGMKAD